MLTPQDIQEKEFSKAVFGGYDMTAVDDFLEEITTDYSALYKENVTLKAKLKVLVEKVEEYRSTEDAMRMALLTAQKMSDELTEETKKKCDEMLAEAENRAARSKADVNREITDEQMRLEAAKAHTASFVSASRQIVDEYVQFLAKLGDVTREYGGVPAEAPIPESEQVRSPEPELAVHKTEIVMSKLAPRPMQPVQQSVQAEPETPVEEPEPEPEAAPAEEEPVYTPPAEVSGETRRFDADAVRREARRIRRDDDDEDDELVSPRPKFDFNDLQFGDNYKDDTRKRKK